MTHPTMAVSVDYENKKRPLRFKAKTTVDLLGEEEVALYSGWCKTHCAARREVEALRATALADANSA